MLYPVIMAGGIGSRLWPLSRHDRPKQALRIIGDRTLFQHAVDRLVPQYSPNQILVVAGEEYVELLSQQVPSLPRQNFIVEPEGRGTAPAIGLAAIHLQRRDPLATMAVLTADHFISDVDRFRAALSAADTIAEQGYLVTLGIKPSEPSTGYGYIQQGEMIQEIKPFRIYAADRFAEKPDADEAQRLVDSGIYSWNSGMFIWGVDRILQEFERQMPDFYKKLQSVAGSLGQPNYDQQLEEIWPTVRKETIDYGVMEGAESVAIIPVDIGWSDVGSWGSLLDLLPADEDGNIVVGQHLGIDTTDTLVFGGQRLVATIGLQGLVIVDTEDALLVCAKEREQEVRAMVKQLEESGRDEVL